MATPTLLQSPWQTVTSAPDKLGESPFWHPLEQQLYWVDIPGKKVNRTQPGSDLTDTWHLPAEPGCIAPATRGGYVLALRNGIFRAEVWGGDLELLAPVSYDTANIRFNDGKCDTLGRLWAGTMYEPRTQRLAELYCIDARGMFGTTKPVQVDVVQRDAILANGLAWSPDNRTMYWADTVDHVIHAWDWDAATGAMTQKHVFHQFAGKPAGWTSDLALAGQYGGRPDGCAVDVQGNYYIAMFEGQRLLKFSAAGALLADIPTPSRCSTMPCFGGSDMKTLFLTTASCNRSPEELAAYPLSGRVFSMQVDVPGLPVNFFED